MKEVWIGIMVAGNLDDAENTMKVSFSREAIERSIYGSDGLYNEIILVGPEDNPPQEDIVYWQLFKRRLCE